MRSSLCCRVLSFSFLALPAAAQTSKLNGPLAREHYGYFGLPITSPDGEYVVYDAFVDVFVPNGGYRISELWSVSTRSKQSPVRLRDAGSGISRVQVTLDGEHVLYLEGYPGDRLGNRGSSELAVVPIDGSGPPVVLSDPLGFVPWFQESRDGAHVLYLSQPRIGLPELFSVPITGGAPVKLNGPLVPGGGVEKFALSNDGRLAVYTADQDTDDVVELFVVPVDGSQPARKLPLPLVAGGDVGSPMFDPDASHVFYVADQEEDERYELFSVPTDGSQTPRKLNGPLVSGGDVVREYGGYLSFTLTTDGRWILYGADQDTDERFELYGVPADGSRAPVKLTTPADDDVLFMGLSHDSAWMLYLSDPGGTDTYELFSVPIDGSAAARRLSGPVTPGGSVSFNPQVTFDSRYVIYAADQDVDEMRELYSAPIDGSAQPVKLNGPLQPDGDVGADEYHAAFWVMQDGVLYQADQEQDGLFELYFSAPSGGVAARKLVAGRVGVVAPSQSYTQSPPLDFGGVLFSREGELVTIGVEPGARPTVLDVLELGIAGAVEDFVLTPAGDHVVYRAREEGDDAARPYSVPTSKPSARMPFHPELAFQSSWRVVPDGSRLVFFARPAPDGARGLYSAPADGMGAATLLSGSLGAFSVSEYQDEGTFVISPDGRCVVFLAFAPSYWGLFSAPVDGSSLAIHLSAALPAGASVGQSMKISADGSVVFLSASSGAGGLHTVPIDGSAPPVSVAANEPITGWISDFSIDGRGERVVFLRQVGPGHRLFSVPSTGGVSPVRLDATPRGSRDVTRFAIAPDGTRVVYLADQNARETFELFSAPIDGSATAVRLNAALPAGRDVWDCQVSSDSRRVVYRTIVDGLFELFSVSINGGSPVRLSGSLAAGGSVQDYRITPDGKRVVYMADQESDGVMELFSTRIQGARRQAKLSSPLIPGGDVYSFEISSDSRTVVFTAERSLTPVLRPDGGRYPALTLLAAPIGGQEKATQLAGPFHDGGTVLDHDYRLSADASVVVYRADQDEPGVVELYSFRRGPLAADWAATKR